MQFDFPKVEEEAARNAIETAIGDFVRNFYAKGAADPLLGPVFADSIADLDRHMEIVADFWSRSLLHTERYQGHPSPVHVNLPIEPTHFKRWLELFVDAAKETLPQTQAEQAVAKASHMAQCFQSGMFPFADAAGNPSRVPAS